MGVDKELVKDYKVTLYHKGTITYEKTISNNYQRLNIINLADTVMADQAEIRIFSTNGLDDVHIFEVRIYGA